MRKLHDTSDHFDDIHTAVCLLVLDGAVCLLASFREAGPIQQ